MSLFPAYSTNTDPIEHAAPLLQGLQESAKDKEDASDTHSVTSLEEVTLLESSESSSEQENDRHEQLEGKRKRKRESSHSPDGKIEKKKKKDDRHDDDSREYYVDKKIDYGNLRVSTLYVPGRPQYFYIHSVLGNIIRTARKKRSQKRYFDNVQRYELSGDTKDSLAQTPEDKTEHFNKHLHTNPFDIKMWLQFVKYQEDKYENDVLNGKLVKGAVALNTCHDKQLSILDVALKHNPHDLSLIKLKVKISEKSMANDRYLEMLKEMISKPDMPNFLQMQLWLWYIEGVQCSMALSSVSCVKDMYAGAMKSLSKMQKQNYQATHVELTYRSGLFLRQCGLWEQLWLLLKLNVDMNLMFGNNTECFIYEKIDEANVAEVMKSENELISSGLPLCTIWQRIEKSRAAAHWRPLKEVMDTPGEDPQRMVDVSDVTDLLMPVTKAPYTFALAVTILRLLKVPLLPSRQGLKTALNNTDIDWEFDNIENCLQFTYAAVTGLHKPAADHLEAVRSLLVDFLEQPNYFSDSNGYLSFVNNVFLECATWFGETEKTAILVWWIRFQIVFIYLNKSDKTELSRIRKQVQKVLKANRADMVLYSEFAHLESAVCGHERGLGVAAATLRSATPDGGGLHAYLTRSPRAAQNDVPCTNTGCTIEGGRVAGRSNDNVEKILHESYIKILMQEEMTSKPDCRTKAIDALVCLANKKPLSNQTGQEYTPVDVAKALQKFADRTDSLLLKMDGVEKAMTPADYMVSDELVDWICCHGWLIYLTQMHRHLEQFYHKITVATGVQNCNEDVPSVKRKSWLRENMYEFFTMLLQSKLRVTSDEMDKGKQSLLENIIKESVNEFPCNTALIWCCVQYWSNRGMIGRWKILNLLTATEDTNAVMALAVVFNECIKLYGNIDKSEEGSWQLGHSNRMHRILKLLTGDHKLKRCSLLWKIRLHFETIFTNTSQLSIKKTLYQALDDCPWSKEIYILGTKYLPSEFSELVDLVIEKQLRLHAMPEELEPL